MVLHVGPFFAARLKLNGPRTNLAPQNLPKFGLLKSCESCLHVYAMAWNNDKHNIYIVNEYTWSYQSSARALSTLAHKLEKVGLLPGLLSQQPIMIL